MATAAFPEETHGDLEKYDIPAGGGVHTQWSVLPPSAGGGDSRGALAQDGMSSRNIYTDLWKRKSSTPQNIFLMRILMKTITKLLRTEKTPVLCLWSEQLSIILKIHLVLKEIENVFFFANNLFILNQCYFSCQALYPIENQGTW